MARFLPGISEKKALTIARANVFWLVDFDLPEGVKEQVSLKELALVHGTLLMGFYCDPLPGDVITYRGYKWRVTGRQFSPNRYRSKDNRCIPTLLVEYMGELDSD